MRNDDDRKGHVERITCNTTLRDKEEHSMCCALLNYSTAEAVLAERLCFQALRLRAQHTARCGLRCGPGFPAVASAFAPGDIQAGPESGLLVQNGYGSELLRSRPFLYQKPSS